MALWNLDLAFADVVSTSSDPLLGAIRLAWWRERLDELDNVACAPAEPRLQAVADQLVPRGIPGGELSRLEDAWLPLLQPFPWSTEQVAGLKLRGRLLFGIGAQLLGEQPEHAEAAGELWSVVDAAQHCSDRQSAEYLLDASLAVVLPGKVPRRLRPLTTLAALAASDPAKAESGFARGMAALHHRATGRIRQ